MESYYPDEPVFRSAQKIARNPQLSRKMWCSETPWVKASLAQFGAGCYLSLCERVVLDFTGIRSANSSFVNA